jgi:SH3-like domain-containing protein
MRRASSFAAIATGIVLLVLATSGAYRLATIDLPRYGVVVSKEETTVRFEPSASGTAHYAAKPGTVLRVTGERTGWAAVARNDGRRGWIERDALVLL